MKNVSSNYHRPNIFLVATLCLFTFIQASVYGQSSQEQGIKVPKVTMEAYVGSYEMQKGTFLKIEIQKDELKAIGPDKSVLELIPITNSRFFLKKFGVDIAFVKNDHNEITKLLMIREDGQQLEAIRVKVKDGK